VCLAGGRWDVRLDDLDLPGVRITNGAVLQSHVMGEDVDLAAFFGANARGEDENLSALIASEQSQLCVIL